VSSVSSEVPLPKAVESLVSGFSIAFAGRTFQRAVVLFVGFVLAAGRHTVTAALRAAGPLAAGHHTCYHRFFSRAKWSPWPLGKVLAGMVLGLVPPGEPAVCPVDDTADQHKGEKVYGKGRHRDACRSTRTHTVWLWGHKWVVLAVNVTFPFCGRPWALPVLAALYRPKELDAREKHRHKTPADLARQLVAVLVHWFPDRRFILLGDGGGYGCHAVARFCRRHRRHVTLVSLFHPRANLYTLPPRRRKGQAGRRRVEFVTGTGHWYKGGRGLAAVRWVFAHDRDGTHEDRYFFTTDPALSPSRIITLYTGRWSIEVTFQEARAHLGSHTTRCWRERSVLREAPCLLGLFSLVALIYRDLSRGKSPNPRADPWYAKAQVTFADAISAVRRALWEETVLKQARQHEAFQKLPPGVRDLLLDHLSLAA